MRLMYGRLVGSKYELNNLGLRLASMLSRRVAEANDRKRAPFKMAAEGLITAVDVLRGTHQWTAAAAIIDVYGFSDNEFNEAEYAADKMAS